MLIAICANERFYVEHYFYLLVRCCISLLYFIDTMNFLDVTVFMLKKVCYDF